MIPTRCPQALRTTLVLAGSTLALACNTPAAPAASAASPSPASSAPKPDTSVPRITGTVRASATGKAPPSGGVVYLEDAPKQPGVATTATINVDHKSFTPFISVITTGGSVTFGNNDALTHHVFSPEVAKWDTGYLNKSDKAAKTFDAPGPISLLCNIHPEMLGYLLVIPSTYYGKVGPGGEYTIGHVPPGTYKATAWGPRLAPSTQTVTVGATSVVTTNFELAPVAGAN